MYFGYLYSFWNDLLGTDKSDNCQVYVYSENNVDETERHDLIIFDWPCLLITVRGGPSSKAMIGLNK